MCNQPEFATFVTDFSSLLTMLVPQLDRLGARLSSVESTIGTTEEEVFWELWKFLAVGCSAFARVSTTPFRLLLIDKQPFFTCLYAAFHDMLQWLLSMSRSPAWLAMKEPQGLRTRNSELLMMLAMPLNCLSKTSTASTSAMFSHLTCFLPASLSLVCCISFEQFTNNPSTHNQKPPAASTAATMHHQAVIGATIPLSLQPFVSQLIRVITNFASICKSSGRQKELSFVTAPEVLQLLKAVLILPQDIFCSDPFLLLNCLICIEITLSLREEIHQNTRALLSNHGASSNAIGLPFYHNLRLSSEVLEMDAKLLHALNVHFSDDTVFNGMCYSIRALILKTWMVPDQMYAISPKALALMVRNVVGLAKQCTIHGLHILKELKRLQIDQHPTQHLVTQQHTERHALAGITEEQLHALDIASLSAIRSVMLLTSNFEVHLPGYELPSKPGRF